MGRVGLIPNVVFGDNNQCRSVRSWGKEVFFLSTIFSLRVWRDDNILKRDRILIYFGPSFMKEPVKLTDDVRQRNKRTKGTLIINQTPV